MYFFTRAENDDFDIDIEKVNSGTYSPLKLHRVSFFLDAGLEGGSPMGFGFDGSMLIPRTPSVNSPDAAMDCFNGVKAAMMLGGLPLDASTHGMMGFGELKSSGYFRYTRALGSEAQISQALQEGGAGGQLNISLLSPRRITQKEVEDAYAEGQKVFTHLTKLNAAYLSLAYSSLRRSETRNALVFGWVACEQVIQQVWDEFLIGDQYVYGTEKRRKGLKATRNVAPKLELLALAKIISEDAYETLTVARKSRNDFAHTGGAVTFDSAFECVSGLILLIQEFADLKGVSTGTSHLLEIFNASEQKDAKHSAQEATKAGNVDWGSVKYWRKLYKIPGDEDWEGDDSLLDGIELMDAAEEANRKAD
ncbi:hypothetical protein LL06_16010 [Hoeflea sp. BAL378]|uniref:hypothetical protein n=1 Tax=Hoeflea sp. BAL378 TaxID=1547437 RepID=UPI000512B1E4|nr:hypothetical protein [Hoeflea sp. BAL378]KGF68545.1 hypothetical protein LL06_16010 [Hoeflea sp. BAL378]